MQDQFPHMSEYGTTWRRVDEVPPPIGVKLLFKTLHGQLVPGVWYKESGWAFWAPVPKHSQKDKEWIRAQG